VEELRAPVTIDASGQSALIGRRLNLLKKDPKLIKAAVFAHYEGGIRDPGIDEGAILVCHTRGNRGWFWYIPLSRNRVSVGVVGDSGELLKSRGTPEEVLEAEIKACGEVSRRLEPAKRISPVRVLRDFSYRSDHSAGDGWVLAGDAFGFLDPVYSSGVLLALKSASLVADSVEAAFQAGDFSAARLGAHGPELARGMEMVRKLVYAFYTPGFSFAQFIMEHPEHRRGITEILIGNVFRQGVEKIFEDMAKYCQLPETRPLAAAGTPAGRPAAQAS
jgi:flavin-dependent dehydrogenase